MVPSPESGSHERAVLRQDNGELQEDVVDKKELDGEEEADEASRESFPASDPPASWAGGGEEDDDPPSERRGAVTPPSVPEPRGAAERVVERGPTPQVPERREPDDPVPGTLPRD